jgi:hypothetical protein
MNKTKESPRRERKKGNRSVGCHQWKGSKKTTRGCKYNNGGLWRSYHVGREGEGRNTSGEMRGKQKKTVGFYKKPIISELLSISFSRKTVFGGVVCRCTFCDEAKNSTKNLGENNWFRKPFLHCERRKKLVIMVLISSGC